jgi:hypothetical protein
MLQALQIFIITILIIIDLLEFYYHHHKRKIKNIIFDIHQYQVQVI